jgi:hypothetical protein
MYKGTGVFIYSFGKSNLSIVFAIAFLMKYLNIRYINAVAKLRTNGVQVVVNRSIFNQLRDYEIFLRLTPIDGGSIIGYSMLDNAVAKPLTEDEIRWNKIVSKIIQRQVQIPSFDTAGDNTANGKSDRTSRIGSVDGQK